MIRIACSVPLGLSFFGALALVVGNAICFIANTLADDLSLPPAKTVVPEFSEEHERAADAISRWGGHVTIGFDRNGVWHTVVFWNGNRFGRLNIPQGEFLPISKLDRVKTVVFVDDALTNDDIRCVANMPDIAVLKIASKEVTNKGLEVVRSLRSLHTLEIDCPNVHIDTEDLSMFSKNGSLKTLFMFSQSISTEASNQLYDVVPGCRLVYFPKAASVPCKN